jgi:hypothetical protein
LRSHTERNSAYSNSRVWLSSAPNGSSMSRISGSIANVRASAPSGELPRLVLQVVPINALAALAA